MYASSVRLYMLFAIRACVRQKSRQDLRPDKGKQQRQQKIGLNGIIGLDIKETHISLVLFMYRMYDECICIFTEQISFGCNFQSYVNLVVREIKISVMFFFVVL